MKIMLEININLLYIIPANVKLKTILGAFNGDRIKGYW